MSEPTGHGNGHLTHPDSDVLAEFRAGLVTGRRGKQVAAHLAACDRCTAADGQLAEVSALLAAAPPPVLPERLAAAARCRAGRRAGPPGRGRTGRGRQLRSPRSSIPGRPGPPAGGW